MKKFRYLQSPYLQDMHYNVQREVYSSQPNDLKLKLRSLKPNTPFSDHYENYLQTGALPKQSLYPYSVRNAKQSQSQERLGITEPVFREQVEEKERGRGHSIKSVPASDEDGLALKRRLQAKIEQLRKRSRSGIVENHESTVNQTVKKESEREQFDRMYRRLERVLESHRTRAQSWQREREELQGQIGALMERLQLCIK